MRTELFLAWRYFKPRRGDAATVITLISIIGVSLGVCVLMVTLAIMTGFTNEMKLKLLETTPHIQIRDPYRGFIPKPEEMLKRIRAMGLEASPTLDNFVLVQKGEDALPKMLVGVDAAKEKKDNLIARSITSGKYSLNPGETIISYLLADQLNASVGDKIIIHSPYKLQKMVKLQKDGTVERRSPDEIYLPDEFRISGIFNVGKYDFDNEILFIGLEDADELFGLPWGAAKFVNVRVADPLRPEEAAAKLRVAFAPRYQVITWKQLKSAWLDVLAVEKNMMFFVLIFIVLVAASSIANTLITVVTQKTREIGVLRALGAGSTTIAAVFVLQGLLVGVIGVGSGMALGAVVVHWRMAILRGMSKVFGIQIFPREFYFFSELPATIVANDLLFIGVSAILLCALGALIPAARAARLDPARALRYE